MAKKAKGNRVQVILECTEMKDSGMPGNYKNAVNQPGKCGLESCPADGGLPGII